MSKISRACTVLAGPIAAGPAGDLFVDDISEVVVTRLNPQAALLVIELLVIES